jgi:FkbM family methyltransferase
VSTAQETNLERLLSLDPEKLEAGQRSRFFELAGPFAQRIVIFGAGELGRRTLSGLRQVGIEPLAIADNNPALQGTTLEGVPILPVSASVERWASAAAFVVATYNIGAPTAQLRNAGAERVIPYATVFAAHADAFLPFMCLGAPGPVLAQSEQIRRAFALFRDEPSQAEFVRQVERRLFLGFESHRKPLPPESRKSEYFPDDLYSPLADEVFIDCGAYDGDTIRRFLERRGGVFRAIVALEPDPQNFRRLQEYVAGLPGSMPDRIQLHRMAVSDRRGNLRFNADGTIASTASTNGLVTVEAVALDEILIHPTMIKMDLEAGEPLALAGARRVIADHTPVLAVCVYHRPEHLWSLPLQVAEMSPLYEFCLRAHAEDCWDVTLYAVPPGRVPMRTDKH